MSRKSSSVHSNTWFAFSSSKALFVPFLNIPFFLYHLYICLFVHGMPCVQFLKVVHVKSPVNWFSRLQKQLVRRRLGCRNRPASKKKKEKKDKLASHSAKEEFTKGLNEGRVFVSDGSFWVVRSLEALWEGSRETSTCNTNTATCWNSADTNSDAATRNTFPSPAERKLFQNAYIFLFSPIIKQFYGIFGIE